MKRVYALCMATSLALILLSFGFHEMTKKPEKHLKVGFILVGDEMTPYTDNFIQARDHVMEVYGDQIECVTIYNVTEDQVEGPLQQLVDEKCDYIIAPSYGYGPAVKEMAKLHPELQFCGLSAHELGQFVVNDFHHELSRLHAGCHF